MERIVRLNAIEILYHSGIFGMNQHSLYPENLALGKLTMYGASFASLREAFLNQPNTDNGNCLLEIEGFNYCLFEVVRLWKFKTRNVISCKALIGKQIKVGGKKVRKNQLAVLLTNLQYLLLSIFSRKNEAINKLAILKGRNCDVIHQKTQTSENNGEVCLVKLLMEGKK